MVSDNYSRFTPISSVSLWASLQSAIGTEAQIDWIFRGPDLWGSTDGAHQRFYWCNGFSWPSVISQNTLWAPEGGLTPRPLDDFGYHPSTWLKVTAEQELSNNSLGWTDSTALAHSARSICCHWGPEPDQNDGINLLTLTWLGVNTMYRWCTVELTTWNLYNSINQCYPNKFNLKK